MIIDTVSISIISVDILGSCHIASNKQIVDVFIKGPNNKSYHNLVCKSGLVWSPLGRPNRLL